MEDYRRMRPDITVVGKQLGKLTKARDIPLKTLETFDNYASGQAVDPFGRAGDDRPLVEGQWVLLGPAKAYFTTAEGGVRINESFQALKADGQPIEGLYAVGSNSMSGMMLWGHGLHIAWAITSGHMLGRLLAKEQID